jgi:hypothetical protein
MCGRSNIEPRQRLVAVPTGCPIQFLGSRGTMRLCRLRYDAEMPTLCNDGHSPILVPQRRATGMEKKRPHQGGSS